MPDQDQTSDRVKGETFVLTFTNEASYEKYKAHVLENKGVILNDFGRVIKGFTASLTPTFAASIRPDPASFADNGISTFERDKTVYIQRA